MKRHSKWMIFGLMVVLTSCVSLTVNVYFPTTEIKQAAEEIESRVRSGRGAEGLETSVAPASGARVYLSLSLGGREAYAQADVDINIKTPVIKQIIESRTKRYKKTLPYMDQAVLGEGMDGYLVLRKTEGLDLKTLTELKKLVKEENGDREMLYKEILTGNQLQFTKENMEKVGKLFFAAIKKTMKKGHWYQVDKEKWEEQTKDPKEE